MEGSLKKFLELAAVEVDGQKVYPIVHSIVRREDVIELLADPDAVGILRAAHAGLKNWEAAPEDAKPHCMLCDLPIAGSIGAFFVLEPMQPGPTFMAITLALCETCAEHPDKEIVKAGGQIIFDAAQYARSQKEPADDQ